MRPFPPEDGLEPVQRHVGIEQGELRDLLVAIELGLPLRRAQRRKHAGDRFPLRDGEPGFREPSCAADQHHEEDEARDRDEPEANRPAIVKACCLCGGGRAVGQSHERCGACVRDRSARSLSPPFVSNDVEGATRTRPSVDCHARPFGRRWLRGRRRKQGQLSRRQNIGKNRNKCYRFYFDRIRESCVSSRGPSEEG